MESRLGLASAGWQGNGQCPKLGASGSNSKAKLGAIYQLSDMMIRVLLWELSALFDNLLQSLPVFVDFFAPDESDIPPLSFDDDMRH